MVSIVGIDQSAVKQITCRNCACRLEYTPHEVKKSVGKDYSGGYAGSEWIVCPKCGHDVVVRSW